jgi:hypothetical protein
MARSTATTTISVTTSRSLVRDSRPTVLRWPQSTSTCGTDREHSAWVGLIVLDRVAGCLRFVPPDRLSVDGRGRTSGARPDVSRDEGANG